TTNDVVTARDALEWYDPKQIMVARGDAVAVHTGRTIKADVLTAYLVKSPAAGSQPAAAAKPAPAAKPAAPPPPPHPAPPPPTPASGPPAPPVAKNPSLTGSMRRAMSSSSTGSMSAAAITASTTP